MLSELSLNEKIPLEFLKRGLIDPNKAFRKVNTGDTMLDNARKYQHQVIIDILTEYGVASGKEMNKKSWNDCLCNLRCRIIFKSLCYNGQSR